MSYLPEVLALAVLILCFRPLVRRAGPHVNLWFVGWLLLLVHFAALLISDWSGISNLYLLLAARWSLDLCAFSFLMISEHVPEERIGAPIAALLGLPVLLQSGLALFARHPGGLDRLTVLLFVATGMYLLLSPSERSRQATVVGGVWILLGALTVRQDAQYAPVISEAALALMLLGAAWVFFRSAPETNRGVVAATAGLTGWGLTFPLLYLTGRYYPTIHVPRAAIELPVCLMAVGVILSLLEEHVSRTERMATHDPLTGLPNRRMFEDRFAAALADAQDQRTTIACLVIDVDNFKTINDTYGHGAGDELLCALSQRLSWHMTPRDLLARTGGDEFTALLGGVQDDNHLKFIAGAMMSAASVPLMIEGRPIDVRISIGIALSPDHADDTEGLRRAADLAMYSAKKRGGSLLAFAGED